MPYSGKIIGTIPKLPHYINPNSSITIELSDYSTSLEEYEDYGFVKFTLDGVNARTDLTCMKSGSSEDLTCIPFTIDDNTNIYFSVEINHITQTCTISIAGWDSYVSEHDFDRVIITGINLDW